MRKNLFKLSIVFLALLAAVTGCELYTAVNVAWSIDSMTYSGGFTTVTYTVQNLGKVDLTGVNLQIGVDMSGNLTYPSRAWTTDFSLNQNQTIHGSLGFYTGSNPLGWATVLSIDMDNPKG